MASVGESGFFIGSLSGSGSFSGSSNMENVELNSNNDVDGKIVTCAKSFWGFYKNTVGPCQFESDDNSNNDGRLSRNEIVKYDNSSEIFDPNNLYPCQFGFDEELAGKSLSAEKQHHKIFTKLA